MLDYKKYKLIFFGSSDFAVPILERLLAKRWKITGVITQPDRPAGRNHELTPTPLKVFALKKKLPVFSFENLTSPEGRATIMKCSSDLAIVASYGQIIPGSIFNAARLGFLNVHPSLLPRYRGPAPIQYALLNGEHKTGTSIMLLDDKMDHGPLLAQEETPILPDDDFPSLHNRLARQSAELLLKVLPQWIVGDVKPVPQDDRLATYTKIITKDDGRITWKNTAGAIAQKVKAFTPWPEAWTTLDGSRFKVIRAVQAELPLSLKPGEIRISGADLYVGAGNRTALKLLAVQPAGKKAMTAHEFVRGHQDLQGKLLV